MISNPGGNKQRIMLHEKKIASYKRVQALLFYGVRNTGNSGDKTHRVKYYECMMTQTYMETFVTLIISELIE